MVQFVARHCVLEVLEARGLLTEYNRNVYYFGTTALLWSSSLGIGASVTDLGIVLELVGAVAASALGFILPGLTILHCDGFFKTRSFSAAMVLPSFLVLFGTVIFFVGTITVFL